MPSRTVKVASKVGLHARPASLFVQAVTATGLPVTIAKGDGEAAAKAVRTHIESLRSRLMRAQQAARGRGPQPKLT